MTINRACTLFVSGALAAACVLLLQVSIIFDSFTPNRFAAALLVLLLLHAARYPRLLVNREAVIYAVLLGYMFLSLLWAPDLMLGMNTLVPGLDFLLTLLLFGSLVAYHDASAAVMGALIGFLLGAVAYFRATHYPLVYPPDFSYNSMANMYLFGLLVNLLFAWKLGQRLLPILLGVVLLVHIAATTSIKTNLGVLLAALAISIFYFRHFVKVFRRTAIILAVLVGAMAYAVVSNTNLQTRLEGGYNRVALGVGVLAARDDAEVKGQGLGLARRENWKDEGLKGWLVSPVLGTGVEAFRYDYGITSHSTPVDLLYNFGVVGLALFYAIFGSITWRLWRARALGIDGLCAIIFGALACYGFMTLSGTFYYNAFIAAFFGMALGLLHRQEQAEAVAAGFPLPARA